jgi:hypothetical protein
MMNGNIYLQPLFSNSKPFGPFVLNEYKTRYVHIPRDRPQEFASAEQIYEESKGTWLFSDNYLHMSPLLVDPNNVLNK